MSRLGQLVDRHKNRARWASFCAALALAGGGGVFLSSGLEIPGRIFLVLAFSLVAGGLAYALVDLWLKWRAAEEEALRRRRRLETVQRRLDTVLKLNSHLVVDANDEKSLVEGVLDLIGELVGALGCSFIPFDEWGQVLPPFSSGDLPDVVLADWAEQLAQAEVRERCRNCEVLQAERGADCPLLNGPFTPTARVYCLPLRRSQRSLGMLSLYLPREAQVDEDLRAFLEGLLGEMALAMETIRLRNRELSILRHLQAARAPQMDLSAALAKVLEDVRQALEADFAALIVRGSEKMPTQISLRSGEPLPALVAAGERALRNAVKEGQPVLAEMPGLGTLLAAPLLLVDQPASGALLVAFEGRLAPGAHPERVLQAVATQTAMLVENERRMIELEYKAVIEERVRLAREIHDGLAQTLAFLKLQVAQMQQIAQRGDTARLKDLLNVSAHTLADAYLDVRQSIDHLRHTPQPGLQGWLEQLALEFKEASGLEAHLVLKPVKKTLSVEVQAQLMRIVQEALNNVRKHAHATQVWISLHEWEGDLILEVRDDGQGFAPDDVPAYSQYGLRGMRERSELIGADFQIISQPLHGTTVRLRLPYPLEETPV